MAELVDAYGLGPYLARGAGSSPAGGTKTKNPLLRIFLFRAKNNENYKSFMLTFSFKSFSMLGKIFFARLVALSAKFCSSRSLYKLIKKI